MGNANVGNDLKVVIPFDEELLTVENPVPVHKDLSFWEKMKAQLEAAEARRRSLPAGLEAVASA